MHNYKTESFFCMKYIFVFSLFILSQFVLCSQSSNIKSNENLSFWSDYPHAELAQEIVTRMTDEQALSQILMFGWAGSEPSALLNQWVSERELGSVKVFGWDTENEIEVAQAVTFLQSEAQENTFQIPLYVATDQEGGLIRHVKGATSDTPGNLSLGASGYPADSWYTGYYIGQELRALGINMNFAPTVDLYSNKDSTVIASRSFGEEAHDSGVLGLAFTKGSLEAGVIPTAKHFPGHGDTGVDSHGILPIIDADYDLLLERELVPFQYLIEEDIPAIMSGHLSFPNILETGEPASLSYFFLTSLLRDTLGFDGLIITDDMMMNGATTYTGSLSVAVHMAIQAGNDIIISSTTPQLGEPVWTTSIALMQNDEEFNASVRLAAYRVILSKLDYFKGENHVPLFPDIAAIPDLVPAPEAEAFFMSQAARSITLYKKGDFPYTSDKASQERVLLVSQFQEVFTEGSYRYNNAGFHTFQYTLPLGSVNAEGIRLLQASQNYDTIIMCVSNTASRNVAQYLENSGKKVIIISVLEPVHVFDFDWADTILLAYSYSSYSFRAAFSALAGDYTPQGVLPMNSNE